MKKTVVGCLALASCMAWGDVTNLYDAITAERAVPITSATCLSASGGPADRLFNGVIYSADDEGKQRVLFLTPSDGTNPSASVEVPDGVLAGRRIVLRRVELYPVTYWSNALNRVPTEYRVWGVDSVGIKHELAHPTGLTYSGLGQNATQGQHFDVELPDAPETQLGYRKFTIEFLNSPSWTATYTVSLMEIRLMVELLPEDPVKSELYGARTVTDWLLADGYNVDVYPESKFTRAQNGWSAASIAFDGYTFHFDGTTRTFRWMGYLGRANGVYAEIRAPQEYRPGETFVPVSYRLWTLSKDSREIERAPTAWTWYGSNTADSDTVWTAVNEASGWTSIESQTGKSWSGVAFSTEGRNTLGPMSFPVVSEGYRAFRFRPTASNCTGSDINVGLNEVEIRVMPVNRKGTLRVRAEQAGCDFGTPAGDGALIETATTVTAPEYVQSAAGNYRVKGYRVETFDYAARQWTVGPSVASRSYAYVPDSNVSARLVWELEEGGIRIAVDYRDEGNERPVTYSQLVGDAGPYFAPGTELTLTAHPNADVLEQANGATNLFRSAFVRWEGDTNGLADVTSPVITFTVDRARVLTPIYRRDWLAYQYDKANEGGSGVEWRIENGLFCLRCSFGGALENGILTGTGDWVLRGRGGLDLSTKVVNSLTGQEIVLTTISYPQLGDKTHCRADFTQVVLPRTLTAVTSSPFRDQTNLVEAVVDCPNLTRISGGVFTRDTALDRVVFKAPKLETIGSSYLFFNAPMRETDANDWQLDSLKSLSTTGDSRFNLAERGDGYGFAGTLSLPAIEEIGMSDFTWQSMVTNVVLGSATGRLRTIGQIAFNNARRLRSLTIGCTGDLSVGENAFKDCVALREVTLLKYIPSQEAIDRILAGCGTEPGNRATLYVSPNRSQWAGFLGELTEGERAVAPAGAAGVYVTAAGERKAWIVYKASPLDPSGMILIFR